MGDRQEKNTRQGKNQKPSDSRGLGEIARIVESDAGSLAALGLRKNSGSHDVAFQFERVEIILSQGRKLAIGEAHVRNPNAELLTGVRVLDVDEQRLRLLDLGPRRLRCHHR